MSKPKYRKGKKITSLDEMLEQEGIIARDKYYHYGWFWSWTVRVAKRYLDRGEVYRAEKIEEKHYSVQEVAQILAEAYGDNCACNFNDYAQTSCPDPGGQKRWEQYLLNREKTKKEKTKWKD